MQFFKVEGAGNDYVLIDVAAQLVDDAPALARAMSDRRRGVGADGLLLVRPGEPGTLATLRIFNADGSEGRMCGNGLRCVIVFLVETGRASAKGVTVQTRSGRRSGRMVGRDRVEVIMGEPDFRPESVPVRAETGADGLSSVDVPDGLGADPDRGFCVSVGNPHVVVRVSSPGDVDLARFGPAVQSSPRLPEGANVHFVVPQGDRQLEVRPFERGSGATAACGTGAVAAVAVARRLDWLRADRVTVRMPGGDLIVHWPGRGAASLEGPARIVFEGTWRLS